MTAYRDINHLAELGLVEKIRGGMRLPTRPSQATRCTICGGNIPFQTHFMIQLSTQETLHTCCPHCGLMALDTYPNAVTAMTGDFLYHRMINIGQASFLFNSSVEICCTPSVLCFASQDDAIRFQTGFGGTVCNLESALKLLKHTMRLEDQPSDKII